MPCLGFDVKRHRQVVLFIDLTQPLGLGEEDCLIILAVEDEEWRVVLGDVKRRTGQCGEVSFLFDRSAHQLVDAAGGVVRLLRVLFRPQQKVGWSVIVDDSLNAG